MFSLVDTHCHLDFNYFDEDRELVLERAWQAGLEHILNPGTDLVSSERILALSEGEPRWLAAVGVHPNDALSWESGTYAALRDLALHLKTVAVGEIGLDYYWERTPLELQHSIFRSQLELAAELDLPVILHTRNKSQQDRRAMADMLEILTNWQAELAAAGSPLAERPGVLHSYSDSVEPALRAVRHNFLIGITGPVTFRNAGELREVVAAVPLDHLLVETDAPFLTPHPHRGERNEPAYVRFVAEKIADVRGITPEVVAANTTTNAARLFRWRENA